MKKSTRQHDATPSGINDDNAHDLVAGDLSTAPWHPPLLPIHASILLVEDNAEMRFFLRQILGSAARVAEVENGKAALHWLKNNTPDLIISDVMMPEMNGYQFLSSLKADGHFRTIPVIMVTSKSSEEDVLYGLRLGVDDYITKPFNETELRVRIFNLLSNQRIRREWIERKQQKHDETDAGQPDEADSDFMARVQQFVEARMQVTSLGIADLADHLATSERQLYRKCATLTGLTPANLIKEIRLKIAYKMLLDRRVSKIAELAAKVGFDNSAYFSRQFFERYGKKPVEFLS